MSDVDDARRRTIDLAIDRGEGLRMTTSEGRDPARRPPERQADRIVFPGSTIDDWVEKALAISPDDRFQSVRQLWTVLHSICGAATAT
jgi:hypothetical protein